MRKTIISAGKREMFKVKGWDGDSKSIKKIRAHELH